MRKKFRLRAGIRRRKRRRKRWTMLYEANNQMSQPEEIDEISAAPVGAALPGSLAMTQRAAALLRAYLDENNLAHYRIFYCTSNDFFDAEWNLEVLGETAAWESL